MLRAFQFHSSIYTVTIYNGMSKETLDSGLDTTVLMQSFKNMAVFNKIFRRSAL